MLMRLIKLCTTCGMIALLAACGQSSSQQAIPGVKVGKPYEINGRWYHPKYQPHYDESGLASWYGPGFHGKKTANGETFDTHAMTAAHPTLPMPSLVEVTNTANNKSVIVRVNDRGPFAKNRIIDLSKAAAEEIGMISTGTAKVRVRYLPQETETYIASRGGSMDQIRMANAKANSNMTVAALADTPVAAGPTAQTAPVYSVGSSSLSSLLVSSAHADDDVSRLQPPPPMDTNAYVASLSNAPAVQEVASLAPTNLPASVPIGRAPNDYVSDPRERAGSIYVQVGAFGVEENARKTANQLAMYGSASVFPITANGRSLYRVRLGPMASRSAAQYSLEKVMEAGFKDARITQ
jgi:rare lipoprotein A